MTQKTDRDEIGADLATVESLLAAVPEGDVLGRRSLKARRDILAQELASLTAQAQPSATRSFNERTDSSRIRYPGYYERRRRARSSADNDHVPRSSVWRATPRYCQLVAPRFASTNAVSAGRGVTPVNRTRSGSIS